MLNIYLTLKFKSNYWMIKLLKTLTLIHYKFSKQLQWWNKFAYEANFNYYAYYNVNVKHINWHLIHQIKSSWRRWGSTLSFICTNATLFSPPHQHQQKFLAAHVCKENLKNHQMRGRGVPEFFLHLKLLFLLLVKTSFKILKP